MVINDTTFEEKVVFRLTPRLFATFFISVSILLIILTISLVAFTPLREYIPGYGSEGNRQSVILLKTQTDSLQKLIADIASYEQNVKSILTNNRLNDTMDLQQETDLLTKQKDFAFSEYDSILMQMEIKKAAAAKKNITIKPKENKKADLFYAPVDGIIQQKFTNDLKGVKLSCTKGSPVFASLAGTVIHVSYGFDIGTCIIILHPANIVTVYQQVGKPTVQEGDFVKARQVISTMDFGESLTFELWINGGFVNPEDYILF